jgi:hypothetical protein
MAAKYRRKKTWLAVDACVHTNPKVMLLASALNLDIDSAVGKLLRLWAWAMASGNEAGDITALPPSELAGIMRWNKKASALYDALLQCGLISEDADGTKRINNWYEMNGSLMEKMREDSKRKFHGNSA